MKQRVENAKSPHSVAMGQMRGLLVHHCNLGHIIGELLDGSWIHTLVICKILLLFTFSFNKCLQMC